MKEILRYRWLQVWLEVDWDIKIIIPAKKIPILKLHRALNQNSATHGFFFFILETCKQLRNTLKVIVKTRKYISLTNMIICSGPPKQITFNFHTNFSFCIKNKCIENICWQPFPRRAWISYILCDNFFAVTLWC